MKYKVVKYYEAYETHIIEAESKSEASDKVIRGECGEPDDVTVKESEIVSCDVIDKIKPNCSKCGRSDAMVESAKGNWTCHHTHRD